jgi:hypothetical protein
MVVTSWPMAHLILRSFSTEANVLVEQQLENLSAFSLTLCSYAGLMPKVRTEKCPTTQGVPLRRDGRYNASLRPPRIHKKSCKL